MSRIITIAPRVADLLFLRCAIMLMKCAIMLMKCAIMLMNWLSWSRQV